MFTITKLAVTAILIVLISEVGKFNDKLGGLIAALPLVTIFVVCWMYRAVLMCYYYLCCLYSAISRQI